MGFGPNVEGGHLFGMCSKHVHVPVYSVRRLAYKRIPAERTQAACIKVNSVGGYFQTVDPKA